MSSQSLEIDVPVPELNDNGDVEDVEDISKGLEQSLIIGEKRSAVEDQKKSKTKTTCTSYRVSTRSRSSSNKVQTRKTRARKSKNKQVVETIRTARKFVRSSKQKRRTRTQTQKKAEKLAEVTVKYDVKKSSWRYYCTKCYRR